MTNAEPLSYTDLYSHLHTHEFLHKTSLQSMAANPPLLPTPSLLPSANLAQHQRPNFSRNRGRSRGNWRPNSNHHNHQHMSDFHGFHSSAPTDWQQSNRDGSLVLGSGLLTALYSRTSSVSCASPSATHPLSALSFTAVANNPLLILLLALFLPLLGFQTLVRTNMLRLILQL